MNNDEIQKFLDGAGPKIKHHLDNLTITPEQARHAGVMAQIGGAGGSLVGAALGAGIGAAVHHPGAGAGIGAMAGGALGGGGGSALGVYSGRAKGPKKVKTTVAKPPATKTVRKSFTHPTDEAKHKLAQGGLGVAAVADAAGASAAWKESRKAVAPALKTIEGVGPKIKAIAGYAKEKAAFPIVAGGIGATLLAEHVMHEKKPHTPKGTPVMKSADEVFAKAREISKNFDESKHKRNHGRFAQGTGVAAGVVAGGAGLASGAGHLAAHGYGQAAEQVGHSGYMGIGDRIITGGTLRTAQGMSREFGHASGKVALGAAGVSAAALALSHHQRAKAKAFAAGVNAAHSHLDSDDDVSKRLVSSDVEAVFAKAREDISKLEQETKTGLKRGAIGGAALGAGLGVGRGLRAFHGSSGGVQAAAAVGGAIGGALRYGAFGAAGGGTVGAIQASARKKAVKALSNKPEQPETVGKSWAELATEGQKAVGMARGVAGFHAANAVRAATPAAENVVATARKVTNKVNALPKPVKIGAAVGATGVAGGAAFGASRKNA